MVEGSKGRWKGHYPFMSKDVEYSRFYSVVDTSRE
jgi:hypothetical protein